MDAEGYEPRVFKAVLRRHFEAGTAKKNLIDTRRGRDLAIERLLAELVKEDRSGVVGR